ncbi:hypothetical protein [Hyphococcus sp.]|uniref:hypothetical protein n=1 Tax=Hyphococcus sp. TaxID=2038636 RepID=UPI003CCBA7B3
MTKDPNPKEFDDPAKLRGIIQNALRLGRDDLVLQCQLRIADLAGRGFDDEIEREFWQSVACAEEFKRIEHGKTILLARTRQKYERDGALKCIEDWARNPKTTDGFQILIDAGHPEYTGEAIVLRHSEKFSAEVISAAKDKLIEHGVNLDRITRPL